MLAAATVAVAAPAVQVSRLMMPAWVQHPNGAKTALKAGEALSRGDVVLTGAGGRVELQLSEGSTVKLGESVQFRLADVVPAERNQGVFGATLDVIKGAFRFTTAAAEKLTRRDVNIRVATVTAGIRGTDLWGKADATRDLVCLIEGKIQVAKEGGSAAVLDQPLQFYVAPKDAPPQPVGFIDKDELFNHWAPQTDLQPGRGVGEAGGHWALYLAAYRDPRTARALVALLTEKGYAAEVVARRQQGKKVSLVRVPGLSSEADAVSLIEPIRQLVPELEPRAAEG